MRLLNTIQPLKICCFTIAAKVVRRYFSSPNKLFTSFYNNRFTLITSVIMTAIPTVRQSKTN